MGSISINDLVKRKDVNKTDLYKVNEIYESDFSNSEGKQICFAGDARITNVLNDQDQITINKGLLEKVNQ